MFSHCMNAVQNVPFQSKSLMIMVTSESIIGTYVIIIITLYTVQVWNIVCCSTFAIVSL